MEVVTREVKYCLGCLKHSRKIGLQCYKLQIDNLRNLLQVNCLYLCNICKRLMFKAEQFIKLVNKNRTVLDKCENLVDLEMKSQYEMSQIEKLIIENIESNIENNFDKPICKIYNRRCDDKVKVELKQESTELPKEEFNIDYDVEDSCIKEESDYSDSIKKNVTSKNVNKKKYKSRTKKNEDILVSVLNITREQCLAERSQMMKDPKYIDLTYKCEDCIKGFNDKEAFEKHMEKHNRGNGEYECDICKQRVATMDKLINHKKYHRIRYKCTECDLVRISRMTIKDHYTAHHLQDSFRYNCTQCDKTFKRQVSLRKHIRSVHNTTERPQCNHCQRSFASKDILKAHIISKHSTEAAGEFLNKKHICRECGKSFQAPSQLKNHMIKHSVSKNYYCVECNRNFKSNYTLKQHLKNASPHVNYKELPLQCEHCEKRFSVKRDVERHKNRIHLNRRPYQCDRCDKSYVNSWSLTEHSRYTHEGVKRPLNYPCHLCDKVFDRNGILESHLRTHTGERPYQCKWCAARFGQSSVRSTHVKLVHLRLTRDGRPKKTLPAPPTHSGTLKPSEPFEVVST